MFVPSNWSEHAKGGILRQPLGVVGILVTRQAAVEREADLHGVIRIVEPDAIGDDPQPSFNYFAFDFEGS